MPITTFAQLRDATETDLVLGNDIIIESPINIASSKVVHFSGYKFRKATASTSPAAATFAITAVAAADSGFSGADNHTMFTVTIASPAQRPGIGATAEFSGLGTGCEYNGTWEVLAVSNPSGTNWKIVVAKKYNASASPEPNFSAAIMRASTVVFDGRIASPEWNRQYFTGFNPGDIRGNFGVVHEVYPEWWGLDGTGHTNGEHVTWELEGMGNLRGCTSAGGSGGARD